MCYDIHGDFMEDIFVTIVGSAHHYGPSPLKIGIIVKLSKDIENVFDPDAISVSLPGLGVVGYVANSDTTIAEGTKSASDIQNIIKNEAFCRIMFKTTDRIIGKILT